MKAREYYILLKKEIDDGHTDNIKTVAQGIILDMNREVTDLCEKRNV